VQFSLLSRYPLTSGLAETCEELGVQPIGYSPLALGLLTDRYTVDNLPKGPRSLLFREFLPIMGPLLGELRDIARARKKSVSQVALNWNLQKGFLVLVGIRSVAQAQENLGATGWSLSSAEVEALDLAAQRIPKQLIQNSFQTA
jgi:pyridoxine 4-dehydrogenase